MNSTCSRFLHLTRRALPAAPLALAALPSVQAAIIYTNPADLTATFPGSIYIDLGTDGSGGAVSSSSFSGADFQLLFDSIYGSDNPGLTYLGGASRFISRPGNYVMNFGLNDPIDGIADRDGRNSLNYFGSNDANWAAGTTGYIGVKVDAGTTGLDYAWIRVSYNNDKTLTVYDFAYETSGGAILAGDTGASAIPEPTTTAAIAGLLAGSAVLYRRRQRTSVAA